MMNYVLENPVGKRQDIHPSASRRPIVLSLLLDYSSFAEGFVLSPVFLSSLRGCLILLLYEGADSPVMDHRECDFMLRISLDR